LTAAILVQLLADLTSTKFYSSLWRFYRFKARIYGRL